MKTGEKYIIEIAEVQTHYDDNGNKYPLARIKGFSSLVFDPKGLDRLEKVEDKELAVTKPQYLNCRFVVLGKNKSENNFEVGNIYDIVDGQIRTSFGTFPLGNYYFKNFDEVVEYFDEKFSRKKIPHYSFHTIKVARLEEEE